MIYYSYKSHYSKFYVSSFFVTNVGQFWSILFCMIKMHFDKLEVLENFQSYHFPVISSTRKLFEWRRHNMCQEPGILLSLSFLFLNLPDHLIHEVWNFSVTLSMDYTYLLKESLQIHHVSTVSSKFCYQRYFKLI